MKMLLAQEWAWMSRKILKFFVWPGGNFCFSYCLIISTSSARFR